MAEIVDIASEVTFRIRGQQKSTVITPAPTPDEWEEFVKPSYPSDGWEEFEASIGQVPPENTAKIVSFVTTRSADQYDMWSHPKILGYLSFIEMKIKEMEEYAQISKNFNSLTFNEVNNALGNYYTIYLSLLSLYHVAYAEMEREGVRYQQWFDEEYIKIRRRENNPALSAQKWLSQKEIEAMVRVEHKQKYQELKAALVASERQTAFLRRLLDSWEGHKFALQTMSKNLQTEYGGAHLSDNGSF